MTRNDKTTDNRAIENKIDVTKVEDIPLKVVTSYSICYINILRKSTLPLNAMFYPFLYFKSPAKFAKFNKSRRVLARCWIFLPAVKIFSDNFFRP